MDSSDPNNRIILSVFHVGYYQYPLGAWDLVLRERHTPYRLDTMDDLHWISREQIWKYHKLIRTVIKLEREEKKIQ